MLSNLPLTHPLVRAARSPVAGVPVALMLASYNVGALRADAERSHAA